MAPSLGSQGGAPPSGHKQRRQAWAKPWFCKHCWSHQTGDRWWNRADMDHCTLCKQPKSSAFAGIKQPAAPS
eukprot:7714799-Pyramimonas_sp.AAC.1